MEKQKAGNVSVVGIKEDLQPQEKVHEGVQDFIYPGCCKLAKDLGRTEFILLCALEAGYLFVRKKWAA